MMKGWRGKTNRPITKKEINLFLAICKRQGVIRSTRFRFWWQLLAIAIVKPQLLYDYLTALGIGEHFFHFRHEVKAQLQSQLAELKNTNQQDKKEVNNSPLVSVG
jgi:Domain of unknown function (DUF4070)